MRFLKYIIIFCLTGTLTPAIGQDYTIDLYLIEECAYQADEGNGSEQVWNTRWAWSANESWSSWDCTKRTMGIGCTNWYHLNNGLGFYFSTRSYTGSSISPTSAYLYLDSQGFENDWWGSCDYNGGDDHFDNNRNSNNAISSTNIFNSITSLNFTNVINANTGYHFNREYTNLSRYRFTYKVKYNVAAPPYLNEVGSVTNAKCAGEGIELTTEKPSNRWSGLRYKWQLQTESAPFSNIWSDQGSPNYSYSSDNNEVVSAPSDAIVPTGRRFRYTVRYEKHSGVKVFRSPEMSSAPFIKAAPAASDISFSNTNITCQGTPGQIVATATGGGGSYSYFCRFNGTGNNQSVTINSSGSANTFPAANEGWYTITTTTNGNEGCIYSEQTYISENVLTKTGESFTDVSCLNANDAKITISFSGGLGNYDVEYTSDGANTWTNSQTTAVGGNYTVSNLASGATHQVRVIASDGCIIKSSTYTPTNPSAVTASITGSTNPSCYFGSDGTISLDISGGTPPYQISTYQCVPSIVSNLTVVGQDVTGLSAGCYELVVMDANGCENSSYLEVSLFNPLQFTMDTTNTKTNPSCGGNGDGTITINYSGGTPPYTYKLNNTIVGNGSNLSYTYTGLFAGSYQAEAIDSKGCQIIAFFSLSDPSNLILFVDNVLPVSCFDIPTGMEDGAIQLSGFGGTLPYEYSFDGGQTWTTSSDTTNLKDDGYQCIVRDANGCTENQTVYVDRNEQILAVLNGVESPGCYGYLGFVRIQRFGRSSDFSNPIEYYDQWLVSSAGDTIVADFAGNTDVYYYSLLPDTYTFTMMDTVNGCLETTFIPPFTITEPDSLYLELVSSADNLCNNGATGEIVVEIKGGQKPHTVAATISQSGNPYFDPITTDSIVYTFSNLAAGTYDVIVGNDESMGAKTANSAPTDFYLYNCTDTLTVVIGEPQVLDVITTNTTPNGVVGCDPPDGQLTSVVTGGTSPYRYLLFDNNIGYIDTILTNIFDSIPAGTYYVDVLDVNDCLFYAPTSTTLAPRPQTLQAQIAYQTEITCPGGDNDTTVVSVIQGSEPDSGPYEYSTDGFSFSSQDTFINLGAGTFDFFVRDTFGCIATINHVISEPFADELSVYIGAPPSCTDNTTYITVDGIALSSAFPHAMYWVLPEGDSLLPGSEFELDFYGNSFHSVEIPLNQYQLFYIEDGNGCRVFLDTIVRTTTPIVPNFDITNVSCFGEGDGALTVNASGGTAPYSYSFDGNAPSVQNSLTNLSPGPIVVDIIDSGGCSYKETIYIDGSTFLDLTLASTVDALCGTGGEIHVNSGYTDGHEFSLDSITWQYDTTFLNVIAGTYDVFARDTATLCTETISVTINGTGNVASNPTATNNSCNGESNGSASAFPASGTPPYTYLWSNGATDRDISNLAEGTYTYTITDNAGCSGTGSVTLTDPTILIATASESMAADCGAATGDAFVSISGGTGNYSIIWDNTPALNQQTASGIAPGVHTVLVTDDNGCTATSSTTITSSAGISLSLVNAVNDACGKSIGSVEVAPTGAAVFEYFWDHDLALDSPIATGLPAGTYQVFVTDVNNCTASYEQIVLDDPGPNLGFPIRNNSICTDDNGSIILNITSGTPPYTYNWAHTADNVSTVTGLSAGNYMCTITDARGCTTNYDDGIGFTPGPMASIATSTNTTCGQNDGSISVAAAMGTSPYTYAWSHSTTVASPTANNLAAGNYTITVSDANGCPSTVGITLTNSNGLNASIGTVVNSNCGNNDGSIQVNASNGIPPYTYNWSHDNMITTALANGLSANAYTITVTDAAGCENVLNQTITDTPAPTLSLTNATDSDCTEGNGSISLAVTSGTAPFNYNWSPAAANSALISNLNSGTYLVTVTDVNGCTDTFSQTIQFNASPVASIGSSTGTTCGQNDGSITVSVSGGAMPLTYTWSHSTTVATATANNLLAGAYTITVTDNKGCSSTTGTTLSDSNPLTAAFINTVNPTCGGANGSLEVSPMNGTAPYVYSWSHDNLLSIPIANGLGSGSYTVTVTDNTGVCTTILTTTINSATGPAASTQNVQNSICAEGNGSISITVAGGAIPISYSWSHNNGLNSPTANNLMSGSYTVTATDNNGCTSIVTESVSLEAAPAISISSSTNTACNTNTGTISTISSGGTAPFTYNWSSGDSGPMATGLDVGNYTVTITDANGCTDTASGNVNEFPSPMANINMVINTSCGQSIGSIQASGLGGLPPYTFLWSNSATTASISNLPSASYTLTVTDANGCEGVQVATISDAGGPVISLMTSANANCGQSTGSATVTVSSGTPPYNFDWQDNLTNTVSTTNTATGLAPGSYNVNVSDANTCQTNLTVVIGDNPGPTVSQGTVIGTSCNGGADGSATATVTGGNIPYQYSWSNSQTTATATGLSVGSYSVTVTDNLGCTETLGVSISEPAMLNASAGATVDPSCAGSNDGSATVNATGGTGGLSFEWNDANGQLGATAINLPAGNYVVSVTDSNGCLATVGYTLTDPTAISLSTSSVQPTCFGSIGSATANASGGTGALSYLWNDTNNQTTATATGLAAGTYIVSVTDMNGCVTTASETLSSSSMVMLSQGSITEESCGGGADGAATVLVAGGSTPYNYLWDDMNNQTTATASGLTAGNYMVSVSDSNGCSSTLAFVVNVAPSITLSSGGTQNPACAGDNTGSATVVAAGGSGVFLYLWNDPNGQTSNTATGLAAGTYTVTVTDNVGCSETTSFNLTDPMALTGSASIVMQPNCQGSLDGIVMVAASGGIGTYTYLWNDAASQNTASANGLAAGNYTVTVSDANGCSITASVMLTAPQSIVLTQGTVSDVLCNGTQTGSAAVIAANGAGGYTYLWDDPSFQMTATATSLAVGTYTVLVTDINGCTATLDFTINEPGSLSVSNSTSTNISCNGDNDGSISLTTSGGTLPYTYSWNTGATASSISNLSAGNYSVSILDANGCNINESYTLTEPDLLGISASSIINPACAGDNNGSITVIASGGTTPYNFNWSDGQTAATASNLSPGSYTVTLTDASNCTTVLSETLTGNTAIAITLDMSGGTSCNGGADGFAVVEATGGTGVYDFDWSNGATGENVVGLASGNYIVTVTDSNGCTSTLGVGISSGGVLSANLGDNFVTLCEGESLYLNAGLPSLNYTWSSSTGFTSSSNEVILTEEAIYWLEVDNGSGCIARDTVNLSVSSIALDALFIMQSEAVVGDTIFASEVSWPIPDSITWSYKVDSVVIYETIENQQWFIFPYTGYYEISLIAYRGNCMSSITKDITIYADPGDLQGPATNPGYTEILNYTLFPNPNSGQFSVRIELSDPQDVQLRIYEVGGDPVTTWQGDGQTIYQPEFNLTLQPGAYVCVLHTLTERKTFNFIVANP